MQESWVTAHKAMDELTANIVKGALEDAGIEARVQRYESSWFDGIFVNSEGAWGEVLVAEENAERAREVMESFGDAGEQAEGEGEA